MPDLGAVGLASGGSQPATPPAPSAGGALAARGTGATSRNVHPTTGPGLGAGPTMTEPVLQQPTMEG